MDRICTGCAVIIPVEQLSSFCSIECQFDFELAEANAANTYKLLDMGFFNDEPQ